MMRKTLVIVGNPNVGKSVIFNHLTGKYATVSNYPGTTVDIFLGESILGSGKEKYQVLDSPGINSLTPHSEDEEVTRNLLLEEKIDLVIQVADAKNLRRALHLTFELAELKIPVLLCLNMWDEARERGIRIDLRRLEKILGIPVVATVAITGEGISELKAKIPQAQIPPQRVRYSLEIEEIINQVQNEYLPGEKAARGISLMLLCKDETINFYLEKKLAKKTQELKTYILEQSKRFLRPPQYLIFEFREREAVEIIAQVEKKVGEIRSFWTEKLGHWMLSPFPGYLILLFVVYLMYKFVGEFAAGIVVDFLEETIFGDYLNPFLIRLIETIIPFKFLVELLVGKYGLFTMALTYSLAIIFPIVTAFFFFFGLLEDCGYLPRLSVLLDRVMRLMGLNGKAVLPMILGLGCGTMATLSSRILDTKKERLIVTILLALAVPCSAQLGVILAMLGDLSWKATIIWLFVLTFLLLLVGYLLAKILPGASSPFVVEIPPIRRPSILNIFSKVKMRLLWYLKEAVPLFILGTFILFVLDKIKLLSIIEYLVTPVVVHWVGLPVEVTSAFIVGFLRRDYGAAGLYTLAKEGVLNDRQIVVSLVVIALFVPCIAQFFAMICERGLKRAVAILLFCFFLAFFVGGILNFLLNWSKII